MPFFLSNESLPDTVENTSYSTLYDNLGVAREDAQYKSELYGCPIYIYHIEVTETIQNPKLKNWRLEFQRIESDQTVVEAEDLAEAIKIARREYSKNDWELVRSNLIEKD